MKTLDANIIKCSITDREPRDTNEYKIHDFSVEREKNIIPLRISVFDKKKKEKKK